MKEVCRSERLGDLRRYVVEVVVNVTVVWDRAVVERGVIIAHGPVPELRFQQPSLHFISR